MAIDNCMRRLAPDSRTIVGQHAPLFAARPVLGDRFDQAYKFAFVRNPWDRFVSWFAMMMKAQHAAKLEHSTLIDPNAKHWKGFDAFLESWCGAKIEFAGVQIRAMSQWAQLVDANGILLTDGLGRFENFAGDAARLLAQANLWPGAIEKINTSQHLHYSVYYSAFGREMIAHSFPEDAKSFGYQFEYEHLKA